MSFSTFSLDSRLLKAIEAAGYDAPTPIQQAAIPVALEGRDLIGTAQTGTGKTAAFVLPMLQRLLTSPRGRLSRALIVTPTRELAEQINTCIRVLGRGTGITSATVYGGVGMIPQERALRAGVDILVVCPGRLLDHMERGNARLDGIEMLVLDEADRMFDMGFLPSIRRILGAIPEERQTMLFSATYSREVEELSRRALHNPQRIAIGSEQAATTVSHAVYPVPHHLKADLLLELLEKYQSQSVLVFTRTKIRATRLAERLAKANHSVTALHGGRTQGQRTAAIEGFRRGRHKIMVATDIAARGIDVKEITHVFNYDIPETAETYIHRIGRTGRAEAEGEAYTLVTPEDTSIIRDIERKLGKPVKREWIEGFDYDKVDAAGIGNGSRSAGRGGSGIGLRTAQQPRHGVAPRREFSNGGQQSRRAPRATSQK